VGSEGRPVLERLLYGACARGEREREVLMGDDRIEELMEKLRELDLETYWAWCELFYDIWGLDYGPLEWNTFGGSKSLLQGVIQDMCKVKKWHHDVCYNEETEKYVSLVVPSDNETWFDSVEADTAAEAIMAAYVAALEAEAVR
jgi:hypothetical protein